MHDFDNDINSNIQSTIDEFGCDIIEVEGNNYFPSYIYTVGLFQQFNHPEIVCFGLSSETMIALINQIRENIEEDRAMYEVNKQYYGFLPQEYPISFLKVQSLFYMEYFEIAVGFYNSKDFPFIELIWPDSSKLFPYQNGFDEKIKYNQPLLDRNIDFFFIEDREFPIFTTENILTKKKCILFVDHDDEGDWFFLESEDIDEDSIIMSTMDEIVKIDKSVNNLYALNFNECATRENIHQDWIVEGVD